MRKRLIFLYRYITAPYRLRKWFNTQTVAVLLVTVAFIFTLVWTAPLSTFGQEDLAAQMTQTPAPLGEPAPTPLPAEYLANSQQTIGITLVGALLVLIVVIGVLVYMPRMDHNGF